jgi:hypothetical protein
MDPPSLEVDSDVPPCRKRYYPNGNECAILTKAASEYHAAPERCPKRSEIVFATLELLTALGTFTWDAHQVRVWFNNNHQSNCPPPHAMDHPSPPRPPDSPVVLRDILELRQHFDDLLTPLTTIADQFETRSQPSPEYMKTRTALLISKGDLPLSLARNPAFHNFVHGIKPDAPVTSVAQAREEILQLAQAFVDHVTPITEQFDFVHLMCDTATVLGRHFLGVCLVTLSSFFPWAVVEIPNQTADTVAGEMANISMDLQERGFTPCVVVTDNASSEINSVELLAESFSLMRVPCLSHTANLIIKGFFALTYPGRNVFHDLRALITALPRDIASAFYGCPTITETRWFCLWDLFAYILTNYDRIADFLSPKPRDSAGRRAAWEVFVHYDFRGIAPFLELIGRFIKWTEKENSTLGQAWPIILHVYRSLKELADRGLAYADHFLAEFTKRFTTTADVPQMLLAYLMTKHGLAWYKSLEVEEIGEHQLTKQMVNDMTRPVREWFARKVVTELNLPVFEATWNYYLSESNYGVFGTVGFWSRMRAKGIEIPGRRGLVKCHELGTLGMIMAFMPVSESGVERIFSHLRVMLKAHNKAMGSDIIQGKLLIKLNHFPDDDTCNARVSALDAIDRPGPEMIVPVIQMPGQSPRHYSAGRPGPI